MMARAGSQGRIWICISHVGTRAQALLYSLLLFQALKHAAELEVEQLGLKLMPEWDTSTAAGRGLTHYTTALYPLLRAFYRRSCKSDLYFSFMYLPFFD